MEDNFRNVIQHGDKSFFFNKNTGEIKIIGAGEVKIIQPDNKEDLQLLHKLLGDAFGTIMEELQKIRSQAASIPRDLTAPPFMPELFLGRTQELKDIHRMLFGGENMLLLVNGRGGVGKTSLASRYYHQYKMDYAHIAWVLSEKSIALAMLQLAIPLQVSFAPDASTEQRLIILLEHMAALPRPCLLVIDNANELEDLDVNYQNLRRCDNFHLLLTTRIDNYRLATTYKIEGLPKKDALELFKSYYPELEEEEIPVLYAIRDAVYNNTLVLELLAKNLARLNRLEKQYRLEDLLQDLRDKGLLQLSKSKEVQTDYGVLHHAKPEAIIAAMYELGDLDTAEVALLSNFAVLPAEGFTFKSLSGLLPNFENLEDILFSLAQKGWIEHNKEDKDFKCSPVIQEVVRGKNEQLRAHCVGLIDLLIDKLEYDSVHIIGSGSYEEAAEYVRMAGAVLACFKQFDWSIYVLQDRVANYYIIIGNLKLGLENFINGEQICLKLLESDPNNENFKNGLAISYSKLGSTHSSLGNLEKALSYFEEETELFEELYESYPTNVRFKNGLAISYSKLGRFYRDHHTDHKTASSYFQLCHDLWAELADAYPYYKEFVNNLEWAKEALKSVE